MRSRIVLVLAVIALGLAAVSSLAIARQEDRATGGGQVLVGTRGAGDTIAFTAHGTIDSAKGQVQYVDRTDGTGQGQTTFHGEVACLDVQGNTARIAGTWRDGGPFQLFVVDNGEGSNADDDIVTVISMADDPTCDFEEPEEEDQTALSRGNAQVHDES